MLHEPDQTQFDLRFQLFGIPVRVHPFFWLVGVILGFRALRDNPGPTGFFYLGLWLAVMFVSILVHELGHVFAGQAFGSNGHIVLYSFGGLAIGSADASERWQRIFVMFAGPLAGFLLLAVVVPLAWWVDSDLVLTSFRNMLGLP